MFSKALTDDFVLDRVENISGKNRKCCRVENIGGQKRKCCRVENISGKKRKCWLTSIFSFSHNVFESLLLHGRFDCGLCGKGLIP